LIHIIQCLCPKRHAILAVAYDPNDITSEQALTDFKSVVVCAIANRQINPWCAICDARAPQWAYEDAPTKYETLKEASPELHRLEVEQHIARAHMDMLKKKAGQN